MIGGKANPRERGQHVRRHVVAAVERFDAGKQRASDDLRMAAHDGEAPLRAKALANEGDLLITQGLSQVVHIVGTFLGRVAPQVNVSFRVFSDCSPGQLDESRRRTSQATRLVERKLGPASLEP